VDSESIADRLRDLGCEKIKIIGQDVMCCCPFHPEREPSFGVHPTKGANCFACLVRFKTADQMFEALYQKMGLEYDPIEKDLGPGDFDFFIPEEAPPKPLNPKVVQFYRKDPEHFIEHWGVTREVAERRGLCIDPTSEAECFPIFDRLGQYWGMVERFEGRAWNKYNYPPNYPRRKIMFGENESLEHPEVWVVEGVRDLCAIESKVEGSRAVALGTAKATKEQIHLLKQVDYVNLALDNDKAGREGRDSLLAQLALTKVSVVRYTGKDPVTADHFEPEPAELFWLIVG